jgi:hypothetical protein
MEVEEFRRALVSGVMSGSWKAFEKWLTGNCSFSYNYGSTEPPLAESEFQEVLRPLYDPQFLACDGASNLLRYIEYEWSRFLPEQREALVVAMQQAYPRITDPLSWFLICELLGEYCADRRALGVLCELRHVKCEARRSLVAMGLGKLMVETADPRLSLQARSTLEGMRRDPVAEVRAEVEAALGRAR